MRFHQIFFFITLVFSAVTMAQTQLSPESYLNKLSSALRGISPLPQEYRELSEAQKNNALDIFFQNKRTQYLGSSLYADKMRWRVTELLKLAPSSVVKLASPDVTNTETSRLNATDDLLIRLFAENKSWDYLLTGRDYKHFAQTPLFSGLDNFDRHFAQVLPSEKFEEIKKSPKGTIFHLNFDENDGRVAGILTSPRFFGRYTTTAVNKNRRRAAAIFKNFLCDDMLAAVPDPSANKGKIIDIQYPQKSNVHFTENEIIAANQMGDGLHGSQADCRACHYKLDPAGKVFLGSPVILSGSEWPGALAYKNSKGEFVNIPVKNINELGRAITTQDDYVSCQVQHFWQWFMGKDVPLSSHLISELSQQFNQLGRRPNDFVNLLVQRPEFKMRRIEDPTQAIARQTKEIFIRCQSCHNGKTDDVTGEALIDLTQWPLGKNSSEKDPQFWIDRVSKKLDLAHGGRNRTMPPRSGNWNLTREELATIQKWIELGTPSDAKAR